MHPGECANPGSPADDELLRISWVFPGWQPLLWKARHPLLHTGRVLEISTHLMSQLARSNNFVQSVKLKFFADQDCDVSLESWRCDRYTGSCRDASSKITLFCESTQMKEVMNNLCKSTVLKYIAIYLGSLSPTLLWPCPPFIGILSHSFIASQWYIHLQGVLALCLSEIPDHLNPTHL